MVIFRVAQTKHEVGWCVAIRTLVFEVEQHVDIGLEVDQHEDACRHILGIDDRIPFAAARWRIYNARCCKNRTSGRTQSMARPESWHRSCGRGHIRHQKRQLQLQDLADRGARLHNRSTKMGFTVVGDGFLEANIPHHAMEKCV